MTTNNNQEEVRNYGFLRLLKKITILFIPFIILVICYFIKDPLKVIYNYRDFSNNKITLNTEYIGWQTYLNNKDSVDYNSFIFGNSCGMGYPTKIWSKYTDNCIPINLNASFESLYAINKKILKLDKYNENIDNALIIWDTGTFEKVTPSFSHSFILHKDIVDMPAYKFHFLIMKSLCQPKILLAFIDYSIFKKVRRYMRGIISNKIDSRDNITNDIINPREREIRKDSIAYWVKYKKLFSRQSENFVYHKTIYGEQVRLLKQIKDVLKKHHTNYKIVVNPNYTLKKFNPSDLNKLEEIFGKDNVFDFSGKNDITNNKGYYYDKCHYRPLLGDKLLKIIYGKGE